MSLTLLTRCWGFPCFFHVFTIPRHIGNRGRLLSTVPAPRSPSSALGPVLSPATPRAAVWGGRGTVTRPHGVGWRSGAAGVKKLYSNRHNYEDPLRQTFNITIITTTEHHCIIRIKTKQSLCVRTEWHNNSSSRGVCWHTQL